MKLTSPAFEDGRSIPSKFTCEGEGINPELHISDAPANTKTLVLIMDDPDVPEFIRKDKMWDHWIVFNIPKETTIIAEHTPSFATSGKNTGGTLTYNPPCPPDREHRYFFKLYSLDCTLSLSSGATKTEVEQAMQGHILIETQLMGRYLKNNLRPS